MRIMSGSESVATRLSRSVQVRREDRAGEPRQNKKPRDGCRRAQLRLYASQVNRGAKATRNHSHSLFSFGVLPGSYLNLATASCPFPFARTVITHPRPRTSFLFALIRMSSSRLNRKIDTADDASIDVGDRSQSRDNSLSIKRVNDVSSQVTMTPAMVRSVLRFLTSIL